MKESVRIARFTFIGTLNALITISVVWLMMHVADEDYITANVVGYVVAQMHNFVWCKYWIFPPRDDREKKNKLWHQMMYFMGAFFVAYLAQFIFLLVLVECLHCNELLAQFLGLFVYGAINFFSNRNVTFR